jgi:hypothetical protein
MTFLLLGSTTFGEIDIYGYSTYPRGIRKYLIHETLNKVGIYGLIDFVDPFIAKAS